MKRFLFSCSVEHCEGNQQFYVDAENQEDAKLIFETSGGVMYTSEVDVTALGEAEFAGETSLDDFGEFAQPEALVMAVPAKDCAHVSIEALERIEAGLSNFLFDATTSKAMQLNPHLVDIRLMIAGAGQLTPEALVPALKLGDHWLEVAYERIGAGEPEHQVLADYGYIQEALVRAEPEHGIPSEWQIAKGKDRNGFDFVEILNTSDFRGREVFQGGNEVLFSFLSDIITERPLIRPHNAACRLLKTMFPAGFADEWVPIADKALADIFTAPHTDAAPLAVPEGWKLTPIEPTEEMHSGLARDIMMWLDFSNKTSEQLFQHLENLGRSVPQWMQDEPELQALGHVPSKATRAVLIYKAMLADGPTFGDVTSADEGKSNYHE